MSTTWQLPEIPDEAAGFSITRVLEPVGWTGQLYENTGAPGGASSVRKVVATAYRLKTLAEFSFCVPPSPAPYATVTLVDDAGNDLDGMTFTIPTHQAFLWWAAQMPLTPIEDDWLNDDVVATFPEDPRVDLLLTGESAWVAAALMSEGLLLTELTVTEEHRVMARQVIDALQRLSGYAAQDADQASQTRPA